MERMLQKMAQQLNAYDEASLLYLWQRYAERVHDFEPSKRWEEAVLVLCLIQAVHWKNQLFNYNLADQASPMPVDARPTVPDFVPAGAPRKNVRDEKKQNVKKATILPFPPKK